MPADGEQQVVVAKLRVCDQRFDDGERGGGPVDFGKGNGATQRDDRRIVNCEQLVIEMQNDRPVRCTLVKSARVGSGNGCLGMIFGDVISLRRPIEVKEPEGDKTLVPSARVLVLPQDQAAVIDASGQAGSLKRHQGN